MANLIQIGLSGVLGHQSALNTTGNNITNANTPGYSRQEVLFESQRGLRTGAGTVGTGVNISNIRRVANEYLVEQVRSDTSLQSEQKALNQELSRLDNLLGSSTTGLNDVLNNFFASLQSAAEDPASLPQRQSVLSEAKAVADRFQSLQAEFIQQRESVKLQMRQGVEDANTLMSSIAELNLAISNSPGIAQGRLPNDLLDKRDEKLRELSELVGIRVLHTEGNQVNVMLGNGQALVVGADASQLSTRPSVEDPAFLEFTLLDAGRQVPIDSQITGGSLGGLRRFEQESLKTAFDELGRVAIALQDNINHQHEIGMDLEGDLGGLFFSDINSPEAMSSRVIANGNNLPPGDADIGVEISDSNALISGSWNLQFSGDGRNYEVIDSQSGEVVKQGRLPDPLPAEIGMPGFNIQINDGTFNPGDSYQIQPTRNAAESISLEVEREEDLAFASPVRAEANVGNNGDGVIDQGLMLNVRNPLSNGILPGFRSQGELDPPLEIRFRDDGGTLVYDVVDANDPNNVLVTGSATPPQNVYTPGISNKLFSEDPTDPNYQGFQFEISGNPQAGDTFNIGYNTEGVSDNRNAELMAALAGKNTMNNGSQNLTEGYGGLVETIGVQTRQSQLDLDSSEALLQQSVNQRESVSGVNLDEEAGRLIQYQAAYNASAQVMSVAQSLFDTLLSTFR
ncbi:MULTISPECIES: flagellar hook-associated protein FlgK [Marinobacter]|uniref:Flagellar hook-associated protein 1 n=1 Tax=Marinobacter xestospongiae TaxID=994319 RepID=A0ABU3VYN0_9GAMM|nr:MULTISPECIES: flagellar hook-associated protein FlgK [Marinobacter]MCG8519725.1 flagellar hook-associated protein FlgK [Pseudomonadales bacterium]MCK7565794.1 flagellar hook-associated protein FlgK [Marinobacter xestospongiae]MDV2079291.1 flagellar hook-associated protein FlgK [Marinobacter xestospongiae]UDL03520.1 flagellar hook-associated protein FlgK [Marinobacter sp. CA1]